MAGNAKVSLTLKEIVLRTNLLDSSIQSSAYFGIMWVHRHTGL